jgi:hypothetical protein
MRKHTRLAALLGLLLLAAPAMSATEEDEPQFDHSTWDELLQEHVNGEGLVDYDGFDNDSRKLQTYLRSLAAADLDSLDRDERLALFINAYNAYTIQLILTRWPEIDSIKDIPNRWDEEQYVVGGKRYSLGQIEHQVLRGQFKEWRIHFAINCASMSCPVLHDRAYTGPKVDAQLDAAGRRLINSDRGMQLEIAESFWTGSKYLDVNISRIFDWFSEDFNKGDMTTYKWLRKYAEGDRAAQLKQYADNHDIDYLSYDWSLNAQ